MASVIQPLIGITLDREDAGGYSNVPWYALRENYCLSLAALGARVIALPPITDSAQDYVQMCDGILVSGGGFDIPPSLFGAAAVHSEVNLKPERTDFELAVVNAALAADKPLLGICGGEQLMAAVLGAKLYQHIPDNVENALNHSPDGSLHNPSGDQEAHTVALVEGTLLHKICGETEIGVNSSHHQAVSSVSEQGELVINAVAPDGVIEGVELPSQTFCLGVQWHPEYQRTEADRKILAAFVAACAVLNTVAG